MKNDDKTISKAMKELSKTDSSCDDEKLTKLEKQRMLSKIISSSATVELSTWDKIRSFVVTYPWRIAFLVSSVQSIILTAIFGTRYTNLFVGFFGG